MHPTYSQPQSQITHRVHRSISHHQSKSTVWLHEESGSGIPHLHSAVCRVDENGNTNNDRNIHIRAQRAAERIARKRGLQTATNIREVNKKQVSKDCLDVLKEMDKWSVKVYFAGLRAKGYDVMTRTDDSGILRGYVLRKGNAKFKASEIGKGRNLMASKLEGTWEKLHDFEQRQEYYGISNFDYTVRKEDTIRMEIKHGDESYTRFIPEPVMKVFEDTFDYRETENWADLINEACYQYAVAMSFLAFLNVPTYTSGGGSSNNELPKKRDDLEEEIARARSCDAAIRTCRSPH